MILRMGSLARAVCLAWLATTGPGAIAAPDGSARAPRIEVFTDRGHPLLHAEGVSDVTTYRIDALARIVEAASRDLPTDEARARAIASKRLEAMDRAAAREAARGLALAWLQYRLDRYPAIVFDGRWVVYGMTDLRTALRIYRQALENRP